jgi:hypothetical protein
MFCGAQDNGGHYRNGVTSTFWNTIKGDGYDVRMFNGSTSQVYLSVNKNLYRSNSDLTDWTEMSSLPDDWYKIVVMSYSSNNIVFASSDPVYRTTNGGTNWSNVGANGRWAMATCPSNSNRVYAAGGDSWNDGGTQAGKQIYRSDDQGDSWIPLKGNTGFPTNITKITSIGVDPGNSLRIWVTMGGFTDGQKVYYSNNGGDSWTNLSGDLPNIPINCVAIDANLDAYIGTDVGVFFKSATSDWQPFYNNMPRVPVTELRIRGTTIYASTFGRGIWKSDTHGDCPASLNFVADISGVRFYEATVINIAQEVSGGSGTEVALRAENYINMGVGFRANASTGEKYRAWIAGCNTGGIPVFRQGEINQWLGARASGNSLAITRKAEESRIGFEMPFDGKASLVLLDENDKLKEVLMMDKMLKKGTTTIKMETSPDMNNRKLVLVVDGSIAGVAK